jgi:hypothetical protein
VILYKPFQISARLLPTLKIGNGWLSYDRKTYVFYLDTPEFEYEIHDFRPGCSHGVQDCFEDMMAFFQSAIEEYTYNLREGPKRLTNPCFQTTSPNGWLRTRTPSLTLTMTVDCTLDKGLR